MRIGEASRVTGLSIKTIRHYEAIGILPRVGRAGRYRDFTGADIERLQLIGHCRGLGFGLDEVRRVLELVASAAPECPDPRSMARLVAARLSRTRAEIAALKQREQGLEAVAGYLRAREANAKMP